MNNIIDTVINYIEKQTVNNIFVYTNMVNSQQLIETIKKQQEKGMAKYGHSIDECPFDKFNWNDMMYEEIADTLIYMEKAKRNGGK